jgi:hypothetical protein
VAGLPEAARLSELLLVPVACVKLGVGVASWVAGCSSWVPPRAGQGPLSAACGL